MLAFFLYEGRLRPLDILAILDSEKSCKPTYLLFSDDTRVVERDLGRASHFEGGFFFHPQDIRHTCHLSMYIYLSSSKLFLVLRFSVYVINYIICSLFFLPSRNPEHLLNPLYSRY